MIVLEDVCYQYVEFVVMLHQAEIDQVGREVHPGQSLSHWRAAQSGNRLDCETGILLRRTLRTEFDDASCWSSLLKNLKSRGFGLAFRDGRLMLTDVNAEQCICSCRFLGWPLPDLAARFGKLRARPDLGSNLAQVIA